MDTSTKSGRLHAVALWCVLGLMGLAVTTTVVYGLHTSASTGGQTHSDQLALPELTPWSAIGGCGAGGSGGAGGGGAKWVGMGATGGLLDLELMNSHVVGQTYRFKTLSLRVSGKPHWKMTLGASFPWNSKDGQVQYQTNESPFYAITGGLGDISADIGMSFGATGNISGSLGLSIPTGQYDIKRGSDRASFYLPKSLQNGSGMYNASLGLSYSKDVEDGILLFDVGYSFPFMMRLVSGENEYLDEYFPDSIPASIEDNSRFYYRFKPYGENDLGDRSPSSVSLSAFYGYRGVHGYVHSWGLTFSGQLGLAYNHARETYLYNPTRDADHQMWAGSINYGIEFTRPKFPFFVSIVKPIHDKSDANAPWEWSQPDWKDLLYAWTLAIGVKSTVF